MTVAVPATEGEREPGSVGTTERTENGELVRDRVRGFTDLQMSTPVLTAAEAFALRHLLEGYGQVWSFESGVYGSKGGAPAVLTDVTQDGAGAVDDTGRVILAATTGELIYPAQAALRPGIYDATGWHVMVWREDVAGSADWHHWQVSSSGSAWDDFGAVPAPSWLEVTPGGSVGLKNEDLVNDSAYSDLVILPFAVPASWIAMFDAFLRTGARAFPPLGKVLVEGDAIPTAYPFLAYGRVTRERHIKSTRGAGSRSLQFTLEEV